MKYYSISSNGKDWTNQWLKDEEVLEHLQLGFTIKPTPGYDYRSDEYIECMQKYLDRLEDDLK